jgi:hypothetical protein
VQVNPVRGETVARATYAGLISALMVLSFACSPSEAGTSANIDATIQEAVRATLASLPATPTPPAATPTAGRVPVDYKFSAPDPKDADPFDPREVAANPARYEGQNARFNGEIARTSRDRFSDGTEYLRIDLLAFTEWYVSPEPVAVLVIPPIDGILRGDCMQVYGVLLSKETAGALNMPVMRGYGAVKGQRNSGGSCDLYYPKDSYFRFGS